MIESPSTALRLQRTLTAEAFRRPRGMLATAQRPTWALVFIGVGTVLALAYLLLVNDTATTGLAMKSYENQITELKEESRQLEIEVANLQSFSNIERAGRALELTEVVTPEFVAAPDENVAVR